MALILFLCALTDIDECFEAALNATDLCEGDGNSQCLNTHGSYLCVCVPGHEDINGTCTRKQWKLSISLLFIISFVVINK